MSRHCRTNPDRLSPTVARLHGAPSPGRRASAIPVGGQFASPDTHGSLCSTCRGDAHRGSFPEFLSTVEVASALNISPSTLNRWAMRRESGESVGPPFHVMGNKLRRWAAAELLDWLEEQRK